MKWDPNPGKTFGSSVPPQIDEMRSGPGPDATDERSAVQKADKGGGIQNVCGRHTWWRVCDCPIAWPPETLRRRHCVNNVRMIVGLRTNHKFDGIPPLQAHIMAQVFGSSGLIGFGGG